MVFSIYVPKQMSEKLFQKKFLQVWLFGQSFRSDYFAETAYVSFFTSNTEGLCSTSHFSTYCFLSHRIKVNGTYWTNTVRCTSTIAIIPAYPLSPSMLLHDFLCENLTKFTFTIYKFIISNFVLCNQTLKLAHKYAFYGEMKCLAIMDRRR